MFILFIDGVTS